MIETTTTAQARKSTLLVAGVLAAIGAWQMYRGRPTAAAILGATTVALIICAMIPAGAVWFNRWWMRLAGVLGYVNSRVLLTLFFYLLMAPVGAAVRFFGHDPLQRRSGRGGASYWTRREQTRQTREQYERSF